MDSLDKTFYKISEVVEILGINASTLRFWESKFPILSPRRNAGGTRFYTPEDIEKIRMIHYLVKEKGLKIEAAIQQIKSNPHGATRKYQAVERLREIRDKLDSLLQNLNKIQP